LKHFHNASEIILNNLFEAMRLEKRRFDPSAVLRAQDWSDSMTHGGLRRMF
jgi:hypothetical protein